VLPRKVRTRVSWPAAIAVCRCSTCAWPAGGLVDIMRVPEWREVGDDTGGPAHRRRGAPGRLPAPSGSVPAPAHCSPPLCPGSGMPRRVVAARSAARSRMRIPVPNCRWYWWRSTARFTCARVAARGAWQRMRSSPHDGDVGEDDEIIEAVSLPAARPAPAMPSVRSRAATGISRSSPARRWPTVPACARDRRSRRPARRPRLAPASAPDLADALDQFAWDLEGPRRSARDRALSARAVRRLGASSSRRPRDAAPERRSRPSREFHAQRRAGVRRRRAAPCCSPIFCATLWAPRHPCRLRARAVRRLHRPDRRTTKPRLSRARVQVDVPTSHGRGLAPAPERLSVPRLFPRSITPAMRFCTPGILMSLTALLRDKPAASQDEIRETLGPSLPVHGLCAHHEGGPGRAAAPPQEKGAGECLISAPASLQAGREKVERDGESSTASCGSATRMVREDLVGRRRLDGLACRTGDHLVTVLQNRWEGRRCMGLPIHRYHPHAV